jgi:hypothetical protein
MAERQNTQPVPTPSGDVEEQGTRRRVELVLGRFAPMASVQRQGLAPHAGPAGTGPEVGEPRPGDETCDAHAQGLSRGRHGLEQRGWSGRHVPVDEARAVLVQDAESHGAGMQVDATGQGVLLGGESHEVSSSAVVFSLRPAYHGGMWRRGPQ